WDFRHRVRGYVPAWASRRVVNAHATDRQELSESRCPGVEERLEQFWSLARVELVTAVVWKGQNSPSRRLRHQFPAERRVLPSRHDRLLPSRNSEFRYVYFGKLSRF